MEKYIHSKGLDIYDLYFDIGSGTTAERKNLQRLIEDSKNKKFDVILTKDSSRLARNSKLLYEIRTIAKNNNVHIITLDNAINTLEGNTNMFGMYAWLYEQESQRTSIKSNTQHSTCIETGTTKTGRWFSRKEKTVENLPKDFLNNEFLGFKEKYFL